MVFASSPGEGESAARVPAEVQLSSPNAGMEVTKRLESIPSRRATTILGDQGLVEDMEPVDNMGLTPFIKKPQRHKVVTSQPVADYMPGFIPERESTPKTSQPKSNSNLAVRLPWAAPTPVLKIKQRKGGEVTAHEDEVSPFASPVISGFGLGATVVTKAKDGATHG